VREDLERHAGQRALQLAELICARSAQLQPGQRSVLAASRARYMTALDHPSKSFKTPLRYRGHPYLPSRLV
jgi:hypothetical protein